MYTRSYPKQENTRVPPPPPEETPLAPTRQTLSEESIPAGYCGTAILREREPEEAPRGEARNTTGISAPKYSVSRARRLKVSTKVTPSLWEPEADAKESVPPENAETEAPRAPKERDAFRTETRPQCDGDAPFSEKAETQNTRTHGRREHRRNAARTPEKKCFDVTHAERLRDRSFSLEDLLLGGLILLLLNEGADDDMILILGFILFSAI